MQFIDLCKWLKWSGIMWIDKVPKAMGGKCLVVGLFQDTVSVGTLIRFCTVCKVTLVGILSTLKFIFVSLAVSRSDT